MSAERRKDNSVDGWADWFLERRLHRGEQPEGKRGRGF